MSAQVFACPGGQLSRCPESLLAERINPLQLRRGTSCSRAHLAVAALHGCAHMSVKTRRSVALPHNALPVRVEAGERVWTGASRFR